MRSDSSLAVLRGEHDHLDRRVHVGVLVPWANTVVEAELPRFGLERVIFHYARLVPPNETTALDDTFLSGLIAATPGALAQLRKIPTSTVLMACTSAGFAVPHTMPANVTNVFDALVTTLNRMRARQIVLATPYPEVVTAREVEAFVSRGIAVVATASLGRDDDFASVPADEIRSLINGVDHTALAAAEALVLSCTGWPTLPLISEFEGLLNVPVVSSNLALGIHAVHLAHVQEYS